MQRTWSIALTPPSLNRSLQQYAGRRESHWTAPRQYSGSKTFAVLLPLSPFSFLFQFRHPAWTIKDYQGLSTEDWFLFLPSNARAWIWAFSFPIWSNSSISYRDYICGIKALNWHPAWTTGVSWWRIGTFSCQHMHTHETGHFLSCLISFRKLSSGL